VLRRRQVNPIVHLVLKDPKRHVLVPCYRCEDEPWHNTRKERDPKWGIIKVPRFVLLDLTWVEMYPKSSHIWRTVPWAYCNGCGLGNQWDVVNKAWSTPRGCHMPAEAGEPTVLFYTSAEA
jgi:hypothetical protein